MKKNSILRVSLAVAAMMAAACTKTVVSTESDDSAYIRFSTGVTRAAVNESSDIDEFGVWLYHDTTPELSDERVYLSGGSWVYDNLRKWSDGTFMFGAFYPYGLSKDVIDGVSFLLDKSAGTADEFMIAYYNGSQAEHDLMTAVYTRTYDSSAPDTSPVTMQFRHLLSKVRIEAESGSGNVTVNSVEFSGMGVYGEYNEDVDNGWMIIPEGNNTPAGSFSVSGTDVVLAPGSPVALFQEDLLLIPQNVTSAFVLKVRYTEGGDMQPQEKTFTLPDTPDWEAGKSYRYTLKFNMENVGLSVKVLDWNAVDTSVEW